MKEAPDQLRWERSAFCADRACAEVAVDGDTFHLRNSTRPDQVITFTRAEWEALKRGLLNGQF